MNYLYIDNVVIDVEITDPTIQTSASSVTMNSIPGGTVTETVTVTGKYLTDVITTSISGTDAAMFNVSPASSRPLRAGPKSSHVNDVILCFLKK